MADFEIALKITLANEGGFADRSKTTGEVVNMGITLATLRALGIRKTGGPATPEDIAFVKSLTLDDVTPIYRQEYWDKLSLDEVNSQPVANQIFDLAVNDGWPEAALLCQGAVGVPRDAKIGPVTIRAVNLWTAASFLRRIQQFAAAFYLVAQPAEDRAEWLARLDKNIAANIAAIPKPVIQSSSANS